MCQNSSSLDRDYEECRLHVRDSAQSGRYVPQLSRKFEHIYTSTLHHIPHIHSIKIDATSGTAVLAHTSPFLVFALHQLQLAAMQPMWNFKNNVATLANRV